MNFLEKNLEDIIYFTEPEKLRERGMRCLRHQLLERQVNLGTYGIADLIGINIGPCEPGQEHGNPTKFISFTVYELKQDRIDTATLLQCSRYVTGLKHLLLRYNLSSTEVIFKMVLCGRAIDLNTDFAFLCDAIEALELYTYEYHFDGIYFKEQADFKMSEPSFSVNLDVQANRYAKTLADIFYNRSYPF